MNRVKHHLILSAEQLGQSFDVFLPGWVDLYFGFALAGTLGDTQGLVFLLLQITQRLMREGVCSCPGVSIVLSGLWGLPAELTAGHSRSAFNF